jgi:hypothetical protein
MKYFSIKIILLSTLFLLVGCGDKFLDRPPLIGESSEDYYQTEEHAIASVNAAYAALQFELTPAAHFRWFWGDIMSDDSDKGGAGDNDGFELLLLETFQGQSNNEMVASEWTASYEGIYRANAALENIPGIDMDETIKARILGEARFIRSWFFYNLVTMFGDVPKADHVLLPSEFNIGRSPASEIWTLIESDLTTAIPDLPLRGDYNDADLGRISKGAAQGLLTKVYLWQGKWALAEQTANNIITSGEYALADDYASIFTRLGENGSGSVFEIQYMSESGGNWGYNQANEGTFTNVFQRPRGAFGGFGFNLPTQDLVDEFFAENPSVEDPRLASSIFRIGDQVGDRGVLTEEATGFPHPYYPKKYFNNLSEEASFGDIAPNGGSNDRVIRYADVLLMHAEAAYHNGNEPGARTSLEEVRARARAGNPFILSEVTSSGQTLLDAIYHERRVELALEGHRFFDLVRTGRASSVLGSMGYTEGVHNLFPIPSAQILVTNGAITQNNGY